MITDKTKEFIDKAKEIHGDIYDYSKVNYISNLNEVNIICKQHGNFLQLPKTHKQGSGCVNCGMIKGKEKRTSTLDEFISKANEKHNSKYDYSKVDYTNAQTKVIITCKIHSDFKQSPNSHLLGRGCRKCSNENLSITRKSNTNEFITKATKLHENKYDYSKVDYVNAQTKVVIKCKKHGEFKQTPNSHLHGKGCDKCKNEGTYDRLKSNKNEFENKAINIHGEKYNYSKVDYVNAQTKVIITCKIHGDFEQIPHLHLQGCGCNECAKIIIKENKTFTLDEFITKANKIHKNAYEYLKVIYINSQTKVIVTCKIHGDFEQIPSSHLRGCGCNECAKIRSKEKRTSTLDEFITKANEIHKNTYEYLKVIYINSQTNVIITCKIHGDFEQNPISHLQGCGCNECAKIRRKDKQLFTLDDFILNANKIHNHMYDYSKVNYTGANNDVIIICKKHNEFKKKPSKHINAQQGCPKCAFTNYSKQQICWLNFISKFSNINIQHAENGGEYIFDNIKADGYCKENNTIYEYYGDFWHGNPKIYNQNSINKKNNKTFGELYQNTLKREKQITDLGFNLIKVWECDWIKVNKCIKILQRKCKKSLSS